MSDLTERWRNMSKSEMAALDVGTLWNAIDDLVDEIERLNKARPVRDDLPERLMDWATLDKIEAGPVLTRDLFEAADEIEKLWAVLWAMAANRAPKHPDDTHVEVFMPVDVWKEHRP